MNRNTGGAASASAASARCFISCPSSFMISPRSPGLACVIGCGMAWTIRSIYSRWEVPGAVPSHRMKRAVPSGYCAARDTSPTDSMASIASSRCPTSSRLFPLCRWNTASVGPLMELGAPSQMRPAAAGLTAWRLQQTPQHRILPHVRRRVPLKHNRPRIKRPAIRTRTLDFRL